MPLAMLRRRREYPTYPDAPLEEQNRRLRQVTTEVLALAAELRKGTIDRIMAMSDLELGMQALLGTLPPRP